jgi:ribosomal protein S18 acetylase RimI-like enzyme
MATKEVNIRRAEEKDTGEIVELSYALFQEDAGQRDPLMNLNWPREEGDEYYSRLVSGDHSVCFLAEMEGKPVGYLVGYATDATSLRPIKLAELESMFVHQEFRGQGTGTALANEFTK